MKRSVALLLIVAVLVMSFATEVAASPSAGLYWGPVTVGNLKLYLTNTHFGYAGPKVGNVNHTNFHVDKKAGKGFTAVANFHITKYQVGSQNCMYVWDSETGKTVYDKCLSGWKDVASAAAASMKEFLRSMLSNADWIAFVVIVGVLVVVLIGLIVAAPVAVLSDPAEPATTPSGGVQPPTDKAAPDPTLR